MTDRTVRLFATAILASVSGLACGEGTAEEREADDGDRGLVVIPQEVDFGTMRAGDLAERVIELCNESDEALSLQRLGVNCNCARLKLEVGGEEVLLDDRDQGRVDVQLEPGGRAQLTLGIDTSKWPPGPSRKRALLFHDAPGSPTSLWFRFDVLGDDGQRVVDPGDAGPPSLLVCSPTVFDHGTIRVGETVTMSSRLVNNSDEPLHLMSLRGQCSCMRYLLRVGGVEYDHETIQRKDKERSIHVFQPQEEASLEIEVATEDLRDAGPGDPLDKTVRLFTDDPGRPFIELKLVGELVAAFSREPGVARFAGFRGTIVDEARIRIRPERISDFGLGEVLCDPSRFLSARLEPVELAAGEGPAWDLFVALDPMTPVGRARGVVSVAVEHAAIHRLVVPVDVHVRPPIEFIGNSAKGGERLDFGRTPFGEDATASLRIRNLVPEVPFRLLRTEIVSRQGQEHFVCEVKEVEAGVSYVVDMTVLASQPTTFFSGKLVLHSEHPDLPRHAVDFRGWKAR